MNAQRTQLPKISKRGFVIGVLCLLVFGIVAIGPFIKDAIAVPSNDDVTCQSTDCPGGPPDNGCTPSEDASLPSQCPPPDECQHSSNFPVPPGCPDDGSNPPPVPETIVVCRDEQLVYINPADRLPTDTDACIGTALVVVRPAPATPVVTLSGPRFTG